MELGSLKINLASKKTVWCNTKRFLCFQAAFDDLRQLETRCAMACVGGSSFAHPTIWRFRLPQSAQRQPENGVIHFQAAFCMVDGLGFSGCLPYLALQDKFRAAILRQQPRQFGQGFAQHAV